MTPRKRKAPNRKKQPVKEPGLLPRLIMAAGRVAARHPRPVLGISCFAVVFSFVSANALWYQPGDHPAPFLATRDLNDPAAIAGYRPARRLDPEDVTTFRIAREGEALPADVSAGRLSADPSPLVAEAQRELARRGLYTGAEDGVVGPQTAAAIRVFQEIRGLPQTGEVSSALITALQAEPAAAPDTETGAELASLEPQASIETVAVPVARPREDVSAAAGDPVAAAIRAAEKRAGGRQEAAVVPVAARPDSDLAPSPELVIQIQRGLSNIAYSDVSVDGVAGSQTRAAIRRFEKHYRLPETGEPNEMVLKKLKSIGAL